MTKTLIFLHGGPGFKDYLRPYFTELRGSFNLVFYDQRRGPDVTIQDHIDELDSVVERSAGKVLLFGHSWGGVLATKYATTYEDKLAGLILMSTGLSASQWRDEFSAELKKLVLEDAPPAKIFLTAEELALGAPLLDAALEGFSEETFDHLFATYIKDYDLKDAFQKLRIPILNIFGERDVRFPLRVATSFKRLNKNVIELSLPNTGHFPFLSLENRKKIFALIENTFCEA